VPYATRDGVRLYYELAGSGDPPLVFVHGWCCDRTFFQPQVDHFQTTHTVTALDLRGCGTSDCPANGYDIPSLADDVAAVCRTAGIGRPVIVGHSLSGMIAIELAARYPDGEAVRRAWVDSDGMFGTTDDADRRQRIIETMCAVPLTAAAAVIRELVAWNGVGALLLCGVPILVLLSSTGGATIRRGCSRSSRTSPLG
jgi:pimeloyl-ACP methyl ester carboxylesterase